MSHSKALCRLSTGGTSLAPGALEDAVRDFTVRAKEMGETHSFIIQSGDKINAALERARPLWRQLFELAGENDDLENFKEKFEIAMDCLMPKDLRKRGVMAKMKNFMSSGSALISGQKKSDESPAALLSSFSQAIERDIAIAERIQDTASEFLLEIAHIVELFQKILSDLDALLRDPGLNSTEQAQLSVYSNSIESAMQTLWQVGQMVQTHIAANAKAKLTISHQLTVAPIAQGTMLTGAVMAEHTASLQTTAVNVSKIVDDTFAKLTGATETIIRRQGTLDARKGELYSPGTRANAQEVLNSIRKIYEEAFLTEQQRMLAERQRFERLQVEMRQNPQDVLQIIFDNPLKNDG